MAYTADWNPLGDVYFRKQEVYSMLWADQVDLDKFIVAAAPYAGPIALIRDDTKLQKGPTPKPVIFIFSAAGKQISTIRWSSGQVIQMGWSCTENLLCIQDDGTVLEYDLFGSYRRTFSMGEEAKEMKVKSCQVFNSYNGTGIAVLTNNNRIFVVNNVEDVRIRRLAQITGVDNTPTAWAMLNKDRQSWALVATRKDLYLLDHGGQFQEQNPPFQANTQFESYIDMAVSVNNKYLALFTDTGLLWIGSSDLKKVYCQFDTKCPTKPQQLVWCATGAVVCYWESILLTVGPQKDWFKYPCDGPVHLLPEMDGVRIIGHNTNDFLQRLPGVLEDIFKIGSMAPGAMLYEASKEYQKGSQKADEYVRMIKDKLDVAVEQCIEAAGHEWEPQTQKALLRAATFGKCFLTDYQPEHFVQMCQMLRVLNAVREVKLAIPLTYNQLQHLSLPVLIDRLVLRREYHLAIEICKYLKLPETEGASRILAHWACYKVQQTNIDDETVARTIALKLGDTPGVSYSEIANKAIECGRTQLAVRLLDHEPRATEQVPLLMKMKKNREALRKAIESGDTDLVYTVILQLKESMNLGEFLMNIRTYPVAHALFMQYCREQNRKLLQDMYEQEDQYNEEANCRVWDYYQEERIEARLSCLVAAQDAYTKGRNDWAAKQTEEQIKLMRYQKKLEAEYNRPYVDLSVQQTLETLIKQNQVRQAEQLRKDFKVPDRRFWWLKIDCLASMSDWTELDKFSKSKKSPIGYEPFVETCIKYSNLAEAEKYLSRVAPEHKAKCLIKMGSYDQAADAAFAVKDLESLNLVLQKCGTSNRQTVEKVNSLKAQLGAKS